MDSSATPEPQSVAPPPSPRFRFCLRTLLLLCVVLGSSLAVFGGWGVVVFGLVVGLAIHLHYAKSLLSHINLLLLVLCVMCLAGPLLPSAGNVHEAGCRAQCRNNMLQIAAALRAYRQANGSFPPASITDKNGTPMHSWRVLILPYLELASLYGKYKLSEPWDGPDNKELACPIPIYACPSNGRSWMTPPFETSYVALVGPKGDWPSDQAVTNGAHGSASDIAMVVEADQSGIPWMEPRDLSIGDLAATSHSSTLAPSSNHGPQSDFFFTRQNCCGVHAAMANCSVRYFPPGSLSMKSPRTSVNWPNIAALAVWLLSVGTLLAHAVRIRKRSSVLPSPPPAGSTSGPRVE